MSWRFVVPLKDLQEFTDDLANPLYEAGCSDATLCRSAGHAKITFDRDSATLRPAIRSDVADIARADLVVASVEIISEDMAELPQ